jgi:4-nitrophenyl phosphatase
MYLIDVDGVVKRGQSLIAGAHEALNILRKKGIPFLLATNNSTKSPVTLASELQRGGLDVKPEEIYTSAHALTFMFRSKSEWLEKAMLGVYVIGSEALILQLKSSGLPVTDSVTKGVVAVGLDYGFDYNKLTKAYRSIVDGAWYSATNSDKLYPVEDGELPGAGALLAAIDRCTGKVPKIAGKPSRNFLIGALMSAGFRGSYKDVVVIGDKPETDIRMANKVGCTSVLVLSGITDKHHLSQVPKEDNPSYIFKDLLEAVKALG